MDRRPIKIQTPHTVKVFVDKPTLFSKLEKTS